ncbi:MAG TPA: hypothetical protein VGR37_19215 [Longimicrobiaceae bacterium]|nr:hypothetical protein [Longimicrobiaceae bacterium]
MPDLNVDLTSLAAIWMGGSVLLVPLAGLTARYGLRPLVESVARMRAAGGDAALEARFAALERRMEEMARAADLADESRPGRAAA